MDAETSRPPRPLSPAGSLLHPAWWVALALLAINDHVLKGSGLLPGMLTGKLSDFAGLLVAPALLATLVRVRSERGWVLSHVAVGLVFAGIQLSPPFAGLWSQAMDLVAYPWVITCDPTDLIALPMLLVSHRVLLPASRGSARTVARRALQFAGAGVGLWCSVATSRPSEPIDPEFFGLHLLNDTDRPIVVRVQPLAPTTVVDCDIVANDPGGMLGRELFDVVQSWTLQPDAGLELLDLVPTDHNCRVLRLESDGFPPAILFWSPGLQTPTAIVLSDEDGRGTITSDLDVVHPISEVSPPAELCAIPDDLQRIDHGELPLGVLVLAEVEPGIDGCVLLGFADEDQIVARSYVCLPEDAFPFAVGDRVSVLPRTDEFGQPAGAEIELLGGTDNAPAGLELVLWRGGNPSIEGLQITTEPMTGCGFVFESSCDTLGVSMAVAIHGAGPNAVVLAPGERVSAVDEASGTAFDFHLLRATSRAAVDIECAMGTDGELDLELVVVRRTLD